MPSFGFITMVYDRTPLELPQDSGAGQEDRIPAGAPGLEAAPTAEANASKFPWSLSGAEAWWLLLLAGYVLSRGES